MTREMPTTKLVINDCSGSDAQGMGIKLHSTQKVRWHLEAREDDHQIEEITSNLPPCRASHTRFSSLLAAPGDLNRTLKFKLEYPLLALILHLLPLLVTLTPVDVNCAF